MNEKSKCTKYALINDTFLFIFADRVEDMDGNVWDRCYYRNSVYLRKRGSNKRIARSTIVKNIKPCNLIL